MEYDDGYDDEPDMDAFNEIMETKIIPRIDEVMEEIISEGFESDKVADELQKRLFNDDIKEELEQIGISLDDCEGIEMNVYTMNIDEKSELAEKIINTESHEDMAHIISNAIEEKDKYPLHRSKNGVMTFNSYDLKDPINSEDIEPISSEQFNIMFGNEK